METITHAAIKIAKAESNDGTMQLRDMVVVGRRHCDCFEQLFKHGYRFDRHESVQGFWTDAGRFLDRYDAMDLALSTGQLAKPTEYRDLYSEDLW